jgi:hypothetical protein
VRKNTKKVKASEYEYFTFIILIIKPGEGGNWHYSVIFVNLKKMQK